jgi:hypothetical protein
MSRTLQHHAPGKSRIPALSYAIAGVIALVSMATTNDLQAQSALGMPFVGRNHLSATVTELSRDGISAERAAVFGGAYGRQLNSASAQLQFTVIVRAAARALNGTEDGILDAGITVAATHRVRAVTGLSITGAVGAGAMLWGKEATGGGEPDVGRVIASSPLTAGLSYDIRVGRATIAPFAAVTGAYSSRREYVNGDRVGIDDSWRMGNTVGVALRLSETVLTVREISREAGLPNRNRVAFTAGFSW